MSQNSGTPVVAIFGATGGIGSDMASNGVIHVIDKLILPN